VDQVGRLMPLHLLDDQPRRINVIAYERAAVDAADLRLQHHHHIRVAKMALPIAGARKICKLRSHMPVNFSEDVQISPMLVEHHDVRVSTSLQSDYEVLADKASTPRQYDFARHDMGGSIIITSGA